jgi:acyl-CoA synthetase (AMP-forming)/AMP-acid ligase II
VEWNFADVWEAVADRFPDAPAVLSGDARIPWRAFDQRANSIAAALLDHGLAHQDKVAQYMRNRPEYLESMFATFKASLVPVNTNYRYTDDELLYLWNDCDAAAVIFDNEFRDACARIRDRLPRVRCWLHVGAIGDCPPWATSYTQVATANHVRVHPPRGRSGDDLYLLYTGGTTGQPKGVMWRQHDLFRMLQAQAGRPVPDAADASAFAAHYDQPGPRVLPAAPLMHGTAAWFTMPILSRGGAAVTVDATSFDAEQLLEAVVRHRVSGLCIVGDAFARPLITILDAAPDRWALDGLRVIVSSGAILSADSKRRLHHHLPNVTILDTLGSSESGSLARTITTRDDNAPADSARFQLGPNTRVITEGGTDVVPGSGESGLLAIGGYQPIGYYKDPDKTAATFRELGGRRYVVAGDYATVDHDGTITLLGRGSSCINTAGEKVYPEEVEQALKTADGVQDAAVIGVPDVRFGQVVVALVETANGSELDPDTLRAHVRGRLASYKVPRRVLLVDSLGRGANGKLDHRRLIDVAMALTAP